MDSSASPPDVVALSCPLGDAPCQFLQELQTLRQEVDLLKEQVRTDALTGLYNFRFFSDALPLEMERASRSFQPLSLIVLDIDHFKGFNDRWGHELGNRALAHIAQLIALTIRKLDFACRFGGEEFVILLPNTDLRQAVNVAERLREIIAISPLEHEQESIVITASLGVDEYRGNHSDSPEGFIERVDTWLYQAKHAGRNCVKSPVVEPADVSTTVTTEEKDALFGVFGSDK
ncbi:GGDEF domain-containing protein [Cellvibrio sp. OA-2007]|uniref:GGDEF domain-containing protein n=1 Tax=Cellvibrio sp. OA-2007 TaxID=529823 RepID=UPI0007813603|nr:GGDEF domain-containing protein [Cellvibrio sp. OA-2007]